MKYAILLTAAAAAVVAGVVLLIWEPPAEAAEDEEERRRIHRRRQQQQQGAAAASAPGGVARSPQAPERTESRPFASASTASSSKQHASGSLGQQTVTIGVGALVTGGVQQLQWKHKGIQVHHSNSQCLTPPYALGLFELFHDRVYLRTHARTHTHPGMCRGVRILQRTDGPTHAYPQHPKYLTPPSLLFSNRRS